MPTKHRRHAVTETPEVAAALDSLRAITGDERVNFGELVILGAHAKTESLRVRNDRANAALDDLAEMVRTGSVPVDPQAADDVRASWARGA